MAGDKLRKKTKRWLDEFRLLSKKTATHSDKETKRLIKESERRWNEEIMDEAKSIGKTAPVGSQIQTHRGIAYPNLEAFNLLHQAMRAEYSEIFPTQPANIEYMAERLPFKYENAGPKRKRIFCKAAALLIYFARDAHAFSNGNKRMAFIYTAVFLGLNGYEIKVPMQEAKGGNIMAISRGDIKSLSEVIRWLQSISRRRYAKYRGKIHEIAIPLGLNTPDGK